MLRTVLISAFILLVGCGFCYMIVTFVKNEIFRNVLLGVGVVATGLALLHFFGMI